MAKKKKQKKKNTAPKQPSVSRPKEFLDLIAPAAVKFNTDHFILGGTYRSVVALSEQDRNHSHALCADQHYLPG